MVWVSEELNARICVCHNTVINWVQEVSSQIPDENYEIPETVQLDELQTFVGSKKTKFGFGQQ